jgi:hypothetical protein
MGMRIDRHTISSQFPSCCYASICVNTKTDLEPLLRTRLRAFNRWGRRVPEGESASTIIAWRHVVPVLQHLITGIFLCPGPVRPPRQLQHFRAASSEQ